MIKVCFICHGNICRSPMAQFMLEDMVKKRKISNQFDIFSRAVSLEEIGNDIYYPAKECLERHGIPYRPRRAKRISEIELCSCDYVFCMDASNVVLLRRLFPDNDLKNVRTLLEHNISDPWYTGDFVQTYNDLEQGLNNFLSKLEIK